MKKEVAKAEKEPQLVESAGWKKGVQMILYLSYATCVSGIVMATASIPGWKELMINGMGSLFAVLFMEGIGTIQLYLARRQEFGLAIDLIKAITLFSVALLASSSLLMLLQMPGYAQIGSITTFILAINIGLIIAQANAIDKVFFAEDRFFQRRLALPLFLAVVTLGLKIYLTKTAAVQ